MALGCSMPDELMGRVSVLIPARNEEANIERSVRAVALQSGVKEIIVANDQSTDRTGEILARLQTEIPRLRVIGIDSLPEGWMGKANALATASRVATGEWLLFTDADTEHRPGSLAVLLARAEKERCDLLSISPGQRVPTWWEKSVIPLVYVRLATRYRFEDVSNPRLSVAAANGQYILVRREVYERIGGFEALRGELLDDVALARCVKGNGGQILFLPGAAWVETRMYRTFGSMWEGWTKNLYSLYDGEMKSIVLAIGDVMMLNLFPVASLAVFVTSFLRAYSTHQAVLGSWLGTGMCLLLLLVEQLKYRKALSQIGFEPGVAKYLYLGAPIFSLLMLNSALAHHQGRVRWKGRDYGESKMTKGAE